MIPKKVTEILIRFSKYGKWEKFKFDSSILNLPDLYADALERYPNQNFIQMRIDGDLKTIKRK